MKTVKILIIFSIAIFITNINANKREKRTINNLLRYFGYRVIPLTDTENVSAKFENPQETNPNPRLLRLRTILPSILIEWTTAKTASTNDKLKSEKLRVTEDTTSNPTTIKPIETTTIQNATVNESTTEFLIHLPDLEEEILSVKIREPNQSENTTDIESMTNTDDNSSIVVGNNKTNSHGDPNFELIKSNDIYLGSTMHVDDYNFNSYQYIMPHFENMREISDNQINAEPNEVNNFNNYFQKLISGV